MNLTEYEAREAADHRRFLAELDRGSLAERIEARNEWREAMERYRDTIAERIGWLFQGSYGKGAMDEAHRIAAQKRGNREAAMGQLIAAVEWMCPASEARKAWHQLGPVDQENVTATIRAAIAYHSREATA